MPRVTTDPSQARTYWDGEAATFDDEPDHGLRDPAVRAAWSALLDDLVPAAARRAADLGCGTGSLAVLLAERGLEVTGRDLSPAMVERARAKVAAAGLTIDLDVGDASTPQLPDAAFDLLLCRHVLWALPDPADVVRRWTDLLAPGGRLLLVEGFWSTGAGLHADEVCGLLDERVTLREVRQLDDPALWGGPVTDERFAVVADLAPF
jgi:SAM-dependent methyltransferase